jgi:hypothetical protein
LCELRNTALRASMYTNTRGKHIGKSEEIKKKDYVSEHKQLILRCKKATLVSKQKQVHNCDISNISI